MKMFRVAGIMLIYGLCAALAGERAFADASMKPAAIDGVGIDQQLGTVVPTGLVFHDEQGRDVRLGDLIEGKPTLLLLVYYKCPMLCTVVLTEMLHTLQSLPLKMHEQYNVITVSFDPTETPALAADRKSVV